VYRIYRSVRGGFGRRCLLGGGGTGSPFVEFGGGGGVGDLGVDHVARVVRRGELGGSIAVFPAMLEGLRGREAERFWDCVFDSFVSCDVM